MQITMPATYGVMEGKGAYNKHAKLQADGAALALPFLEKAIEKTAMEAGNSPLVIADYGSSQGKNSLAPIGVAIKQLRKKAGPDRPIFVFHVDLPANDFSALFDVIDADLNTYVLNEPNVFACAIGRSFYKRVLPPDSVDFGWSSYAAIWLSRIPTPIPGHFAAVHCMDSVRAAFDRQAAEDWETFLSLRANELRPGGRMVIVGPAFDDDGLSGFEDLFDHANEVLSEMVCEATITAEERARMTLAGYPRRKCDLLAPFSHDGQFHGLVVEACDVALLEDAAWVDYQRTGDKEAIANRHSMFFRSTFMPSLACGLACPDEERRRAFASDLERHLKRRLMEQPVAAHSLVATMVLAKHGSSS